MSFMAGRGGSSLRQLVTTNEAVTTAAGGGLLCPLSRVRFYFGPLARSEAVRQILIVSSGRFIYSIKKTSEFQDMTVQTVGMKCYFILY